MKIITATLGKYSVSMRIDDGVSEEEAQDMCNKKVAELYLKSDLEILRKTIDYLMK